MSCCGCVLSCVSLVSVPFISFMSVSSVRPRSVSALCVSLLLVLTVREHACLIECVCFIQSGTKCVEQKL